ncbi:MAG TPA: DNA (cytosine-5-)-methyltransferase [Anaerolineae bacterium]|nr:DNA (cytosine-5-)-methyltransferase [Anaerolineae bacterium]
MTFGSLFAGIGGLDLGLERAGMTCKWQVENDAYAVKVLEKHWPHVTRYGDIREVDWTGVEPVDLICAGFPCQDVSVAGKRAGIEGERTGLWTEVIRCFRDLRPRLVLLENVPGLLSLGFGRVLGDLAEGGYDAEWDCIPAAAVGVPHRRYRVLILAHAKGGGVGREGEGDEDARLGLACGGEGLAGGGPYAGVADPNGPETLRSPESWLQCDTWATEPDVDRVAHGVPRRVDRLRCLGNAVVPQVAEWIGRRIVEATGGVQGELWEERG